MMRAKPSFFISVLAKERHTLPESRVEHASRTRVMPYPLSIPRGLCGTDDIFHPPEEWKLELEKCSA